MAPETTADHRKVVFSWGKVRKTRFSQNPLNSQFWAFWFSIYTLSCANFKKIHCDKLILSGGNTWRFLALTSACDVAHGHGGSNDLLWSKNVMCFTGGPKWPFLIKGISPFLLDFVQMREGEGELELCAKRVLAVREWFLMGFKQNKIWKNPNGTRDP